MMSRMIKIFSKTISYFLLALFVLPSIVKFEHHHQHIEFKNTSEKQFHEAHEKCNICSFEFAVFLADVSNIEFPKENPTDFYFNHYNSRYSYSLTQYSYLLRAPPINKFEL